ncbi:hypothetical protein ES705_39513 [subsurface metagenome]
MNKFAINQRIVKYIEKTEPSYVEFAKKHGIASQNVTLWKSNKSNVSTGIIFRTLELDKKLNPRWLLFGDGEMFESDKQLHKAMEDINLQITTEGARDHLTLIKELKKENDSLKQELLLLYRRVNNK